MTHEFSGATLSGGKTARRTPWAALLLAAAVLCAPAAPPARAQASGPWISANYIFIAPTTAQMLGDGYQPGAPLSLEVTDPSGAITTATLFADDEGRIQVDVYVDAPGVYWGRVRDGLGRLLAEGELFVGTD